MPGLFRSRLARRLTALFLAASVLPLAGAGYLVLRDLERTTLADAQRRQASLGDAAAGLVRQWIARSTDKLETMGRLRPESVTQSSRSVLEELRYLVEPANLFLEIQQIGGSTQSPKLLGQTSQTELQVAQKRVSNADEQRMAQFLANVRSPAVQDLYRGKRRFQSMQPATNFGFRTLTISARYDTAKGKGGVLVGSLDLRRLDELLRAVVSDTQLVVQSKKGKIISTAGAAMEDPIEHRSPVGYSDWDILVREPRERVVSSFRDARQRVLIGLAIAVLFACVASFFFASRILRPVATLTAAAEKLERGDLAARSGIDRTDEIGRLGRSFDAMAAALETLDNAKSTFVGTVSHELRTPLTSMRLSVANLADGVVGPLDARQQAAVDRIARDVDRLIARVSDLLALAKIESGVETARLEDIDLAAVAATCADALEPLAASRGMRIEVRGAGHGHADRGMIERIVTNLVDNAIKFGPENGTVTIEVAGGTLRVRDEGAGIGSESLFDAFSQGTTEGVKNTGVGLGLSIVKKLAALQGAKIRIVPGTTSCLELTLGESKAA